MSGKVSPIRKRYIYSKKHSKSSSSVRLSDLDNLDSPNDDDDRTPLDNSTSTCTSTCTSTTNIIAMLDAPPFSVDKEPVDLPSLADCQSDSFGGGLNVDGVGSCGNGDLANVDLPSLADTSDCGSSFSAGSSVSSSPAKGGAGTPRSNRRIRRHATAVSPPVEGGTGGLARSTTVPVGNEMRIRVRSSQDSVVTAATTNTRTTTDTLGTTTTLPVTVDNHEASHFDCQRVLLNSFNSLTSFLTCTASDNSLRSRCCPNFCPNGCITCAGGLKQVQQDTKAPPPLPQSERDPTSTTRQTPPPLQNNTPNTDSSKDIRQLQQVRERIEQDILAIMGCTADSAEFCMSNSIFCNPNEHGSDDDDHTISSACGLAAGGLLGMRQGREVVPPSTRPSTRVRNRNVFAREKATRRIERLRKGGLSRTFSLAPVSAFLEEEIKGIGSDGISGAQGATEHSRTYSDEDGAGPSSETGAKAKTSFLRKLGQQYPLQITQSAEYVTLQKSAREKSYNDVRPHASPHDCRSATYDDSDNHSILSTSLLALPKQFEETIGLVHVPSAPFLPYNPGGSELYYDSDPGCATHGDMEPRGRAAPDAGPAVPRVRTPPKVNRPTSPRSFTEKKPKYPLSPKSKKHRKEKKQKQEELRQKQDEQRQEEDAYRVVAKPKVRKKEDGEPSMGSIKPSLLYTVDVKTFDVNNGNLVSQFIEELTNGYLSLIWHPAPNQISSSPTNPTPLHAQAWFEMGTCLKTTLIQPKFMWRGAYHRPNDDDSSDANHNLRGPAFQTPHFVELLNIVRVIAPKTIDRKLYPFCRFTHAFTVGTSQEETFLFEAATEKERNRFVLGLKLVVARLASKIIVGDKGVFDDFFSPWGPRYKSKGKGGGRSKPSSQLTKRKPMKEEKPVPAGGVSGANFITASVNGEGKRTDELWGAA